MIRSIFLALALLLPVSWTVARAADEAPAGECEEGEEGEEVQEGGRRRGEKKAEDKK